MVKNKNENLSGTEELWEHYMPTPNGHREVNSEVSSSTKCPPKKIMKRSCITNLTAHMIALEHKRKK